jgi:hypothetical protein
MNFNDLPFDELIKPVDGNVGKGTIEERFSRFHERNPHVYEALRQIALWCHRNGKRMGIKAIYERARWEFNIRTDGEPYRLNNNFTALYARKIMSEEPQLVGFFETRRRRAT